MLLSLLLVILLASPCYSAKKNDVKFERISIEQNVVQSPIYSITQDDKGFLWIGTEFGLYKYDGYTFVKFQNDYGDSTTISNDFITSLCQDSNDALWIGTIGEGFNKFLRTNQSFQRFHGSGTINLRQVRSIIEEKKDVLLVGTSNGLYRYICKTNSFKKFITNSADADSLLKGPITSLFKDNSGTIWIGTFEGLVSTDSIQSESTVYRHNPHDSKSISGNYITAIHEDTAGFIWIGTSGMGLNRLNRGQGEFTRYQNIPNDQACISDDFITSICEDQSGELWIGTNKGLNTFDSATNTFSRYQTNPEDPASLSHNAVLSLYVDQSGILWIGTLKGGLNKVNSNEINFNHITLVDISDSLSADYNTVWSIVEDREGSLWIGTGNGGLHRYNPEKRKFTQYKNNPSDPFSISDNSIQSLYVDRGGVLWVGTKNGGLDRFNRDTNRFYRFTHDPDNPNSLSNNNITTLFEDHEGILWIGTNGGGLNRFERSTGRFFCYKNEINNPYSLSDNSIRSMCEDHSNTLWIGTRGGLHSYDSEHNRFIRYQSRSGSIFNIISLHNDRSGALWVGTWGDGLYRFDKASGTSVRYRVKDGLSNDIITGILEDYQGNLWLSTFNGLSKYDLSNNVFKKFDVRDGLQGKMFIFNSCYKSISGELFFGGVNGFNRFYPERIRENPHIPSVVITDFQIFNKSVVPGMNSQLKESIIDTKEIELSYRDKVLSFEFVALDFSSPLDNQYAYIMEEFEPNWNYVGARRFVSYTNLFPGKYVFRVKGANNDGIWNEESTSIQITILPPFWKTIWFRFFAFLVAIGIIVGIYSLRTRALRMEKQKLDTMVQERTLELRGTQAQLVQSEKMASLGELVAGIAHEINTPLGVINSNNDMIQRYIRRLNESEHLDPSDVQIIEKINEKSEVSAMSNESILNIVNSLRVFARLDEAEYQTAAVHELMDNTLVIMKNKLKHGIKTEKDYRYLKPIECFPSQLNQVFINVINNAYDAMEGEGTLSITISEENVNIKISIVDSGPGIPEDDLQKIFDPGFTTKGVGVGTGLGLSICYRIIVEKHGGKIRAENRAEGGACLKIEL